MIGATISLPTGAPQNIDTTRKINGSRTIAMRSIAPLILAMSTLVVG
jgi:hypothetical protein